MKSLTRTEPTSSGFLPPMFGSPPISNGSTSGLGQVRSMTKQSRPPTSGTTRRLDEPPVQFLVVLPLLPDSVRAQHRAVEARVAHAVTGGAACQRAVHTGLDGGESQPGGDLVLAAALFLDEERSR